MPSVPRKKQHQGVGAPLILHRNAKSYYQMLGAMDADSVYNRDVKEFLLEDHVNARLQVKSIADRLLEDKPLEVWCEYE